MPRTKEHVEQLPETLYNDDWYESWKQVRELARIMDLLNGGVEQNEAFLANLEALKERLEVWVGELAEEILKARADDQWLDEFYRRVRY